MRLLAIALLAVAALMGGTGEVRGQEFGKTKLVVAFCTDLVSLRAMAGVHVEAFAIYDETGIPEDWSEIYFEFMYNYDDEFNCFDARLTGSMPFRARFLGRVDMPAVSRPDCQEMWYEEFWTQSFNTVYSWRVAEATECGDGQDNDRSA